MRTSELDYDLPDDRIATAPATPRESARLMVVRRSDASAGPIHATIADLPSFLAPGDLLVVNDTRVAPALLSGVVEPTGAAMEGLWIAEVQRDPLIWRVMLRTRRPKPGKRVRLRRRSGELAGVALELVDRAEGEGGGVWLARVDREEGEAGLGTMDLLARVGLTPLPPYIRKARAERGEAADHAEDAAWYQTVYAAEADALAASASVAAPTAGLHLTPGLLATLEGVGVERRAVRLDVGIGTFRPVTAERLEDHDMHSEWCSMSAASRAAIFEAPRRRVIAVGSTSARTIEAYARERAAGREPEAIETDLMLSPGSDWLRVDGMLTNFHLPRSTLLAMVGSMLEGGVPRLLALYREAVDRGYRFFSYGDAMLLLP